MTPEDSKRVAAEPVDPPVQAEAEAGEVTVPREAWRALSIGAAGFVLVGFNTTATNIAFGDIADSFPSVPETTIAFVSSGYLIGTAAFLPLAGRVADRQGRARMFLALHQADLVLDV